MNVFYDGYQFLRNKEVWTCKQWREPIVGTREPSWACESDTGLQAVLPVSDIALFPQVIAGPQWEHRPADLEPAEHVGTRGRYIRGCRCRACKAANADYIKAWRWRRGV